MANQEEKCHDPDETGSSVEPIHVDSYFGQNRKKEQALDAEDQKNFF